MLMHLVSTNTAWTACIHEKWMSWSYMDERRAASTRKRGVFQTSARKPLCFFQGTRWEVGVAFMDFSL
jgi:hypothetical protein